MSRVHCRAVGTGRPHPKATLWWSWKTLCTRPKRPKGLMYRVTDVAETITCQRCRDRLPGLKEDR